MSFSGAYPWRKTRDSLIELRAALPLRVARWAGGGATAGRGRGIEGVLVLDDLATIQPVLAKWCAAQETPARA